MAIDQWNLDVTTPLRRDNAPTPNAQHPAKYPLPVAPVKQSPKLVAPKPPGPEIPWKQTPPLNPIVVLVVLTSVADHGRVEEL